MKRVAIVGIGTLPWCSRYEDKVWFALGLQAAKKAMRNAGLTKDDIDAGVYSIAIDILIRQQIPCLRLHEYLGFGPKPGIRALAGGATDMAALYTAFSEVASGMSDVVLCLSLQKGGDLYCSETRSRGDGLLRAMSFAFDTVWLEPVTPGVPAFLTASYLAPHMEKYGTPNPTQLAKASVKNHKNALLNPESQLKVDLSVDDVLNSRIIAWPTTKYQCCLMSDGAAALILASEEKAREITDTPIWISGIAMSTSSSWPLEPDNFGRMVSVATAGRKAYQMAGIKDPLHELDVMEFNDIITGVEVLAYEELGLCEPGQGGRLVDEGVFERGGLLPVNPTGGRVACGHVDGVSGIYSAAKIVQQLCEEAGDIQVPIRNGKGLVGSIDGYGAISGVAILER